MQEGAVEGSVVLGGGPSAVHSAAAAAAESAGATTETSTSAAEPYRPWVVRLLARHRGALLTGLYLALTSIGVIYDFFYFLRFRVDILDYAQAGDFLVAALRAPRAEVLERLRRAAAGGTR